MASMANGNEGASDDLPEIKEGNFYAGAYRIIRLLGEGGMGSVFLAQDIRSGNREVALKIIHGRHVHSGTMASGFSLGGQSAEARFLASCAHPSILPVYDAGVDSQTGFAYLTMRPSLLSGREVAHLCDDIFRCPYPRNLPGDGDVTCSLTLRDLVKGGKALPEDAVARIGIDLAEALACTHGQSPPIVHRDIKPSNILFDAGGRAILSDFGIAKSLLAGDCAAESSIPSTLQPCGGRPTFVGTPAYAAPEQKAGDPATPASDYYSLGVILHEILTGERPWGDIAPSKYDPVHISPRWNALLRGLLADDPRDRLANSDEILRTLRAILKHGGGRRGRQPLLVAAVCAAAIAAVGVLTIAVGGREDAAGRIAASPGIPATVPDIPPPPEDPEVVAARTEDVRAKVELLRHGPIWPYTPEPWFPGILFAPRPENNARHPEGAVFEMLLPDGTPMQFSAMTLGMEARCFDYAHGFFSEANGQPNMTKEERRANRTVVSKRLLFSRTEVTREQFAAVMSATNAVPLQEMTVYDWTNAPVAMARLGMGPKEFGSRLRYLQGKAAEAGKKLEDYRFRAVFLRVAQEKAPSQGMPAAEGIRFGDVERFISKLNSLCPPGCMFRLPTEAEWEAMCRLKNDRRFEGEEPDAVCWSRENSGGAPHPVARKKPNFLGVFDMHGNVAEWCLDGFGPMARPAFDPLLPVPPNGFHVVRGGSWADPAEECGSEVRKGAGPDATGIGFRLVLEY